MSTTLETLVDSSATPDQMIGALYGLGISSTNRLPAMLRLTAFSTPGTFWRVFNECWPSCDDTWDWQGDLLNAFEHFGREELSPQNLMTAETADFLSQLPDRITIYRGCDKSRVKAVSWTTNPEVAKAFARGHRGIRRPNPVLMTARVWRRNVITAFQDRDESEVIIDPASLRYLREIKTSDTASAA